MENNNRAVETMRQLVALGINRRLNFVIWDNLTLKVSKGENGCMVRYNEATDLYDVTEYHGFDVLPEQQGFFGEGLLASIMPTLTPREGYGELANECSVPWGAD